MYPRIRCLMRLAAAAIVVSLVCATRAPGATETPPSQKVREPAVAGGFYPKDPAELARMIDTCLALAHPPAIPGKLEALICPHAGYPFSGPVAAFAYKLLVGRSYETVVVMGPSHYAELRSASVTDADLYRTPLGDVPVSAKARALAEVSPFALEPPCLVQRPDWWAASSRSRPKRETADTWEHSVEVEVPFLQRTLTNFQLVSIVFAEVSPVKAAQALEKILDDHTLLVVSSDLSHYHPYAAAREMDGRTIAAICNLDPSGIADDDACGHTPIRTLLYLARDQGWKAKLLDYRNSGDTTGDKARGVVGYAAIAFYSPETPGPTAAPPAPAATAAPAAPAKTAAPAPAAQYSPKDRSLLLALARRTVRAVAAGGDLPDVPADGLSPSLTADRGCFVTLTIRGELRGCIGYIVPQGPLIRAVVENARNAAMRDPRFSPVTPREADRLEIEISVLTPPQPLAFSSPEDLLRRLRPGVDGVVLQIGHRSATYLPQVWEQIPDKEDFLSNLAEKAGCAPSAWRQSGTAVYTYQVEAFKESEPSTTN